MKLKFFPLAPSAIQTFATPMPRTMTHPEPTMAQIRGLPTTLARYKTHLTSIERGLHDHAQAQSQVFNFVEASVYDVAKVRLCIAMAFEHWKHRAADVPETRRKLRICRWKSSGARSVRFRQIFEMGCRAR